MAIGAIQKDQRDNYWTSDWMRKIDIVIYMRIVTQTGGVPLSRKN